MEQTPSWEVNRLSASQEIPRNLWKPKVHVSPRHLSLSWATTIQSMPWRCMLILSSHLCLILPSSLFPSGFPTKTLYAPLISSIRATCLAHLFHLGLITQILLGEEYKPLCSSLCSCLHSLVTSCLGGQNILLSTLFSNTLSLRSSLNVSDHVSHPYKTRSKFKFLIILIFMFLDSELEDKRFLHRKIASIPWFQSALHFFPNRIWIC